MVYFGSAASGILLGLHSFLVFFSTFGGIIITLHLLAVIVGSFILVYGVVVEKQYY